MNNRVIFFRLLVLMMLFHLISPTPAVTQTKSQTLVFIGDCITADYYDGWFHYTDVLAGMLPWKDLWLINKAAGGCGAYSYHDYPSLIDTFILDFKPDYVLSCLGMADMHHSNATKFHEDYKWLIESLLTEKPGIKLFLCRFTWTSGYAEDLLESYMVKIDELAMEYNLPVADLYNTTKGHLEFFIDGSHPSYLGAVTIAETIDEALSEYIIAPVTSTTTSQLVNSSNQENNTASLPVWLIMVLPLLVLKRKWDSY